VQLKTFFFFKRRRLADSPYLSISETEKEGLLAIKIEKNEA